MKNKTTKKSILKTRQEVWGELDELAPSKETIALQKRNDLLMKAGAKRLRTDLKTLEYVKLLRVAVAAQEVIEKLKIAWGHHYPSGIEVHNLDKALQSLERIYK